jgi:SET domain-containing protein
MTNCRTESWIDPRVERGQSAIEGFGTFAKAPIRAGEVVFVFGGNLITDADAAAGKVIDHSYVNVAEGLYLGHRVEVGVSVDDFLNHSCQPNI